MKRFFLLLFVLSGFLIFSAAQQTPDPRKWNILPEGDTKVDIPAPVFYNVPQNNTPRFFPTPEGTGIVYPNKRVHPNTTFWQSEVPIISHPTNKNIMFGSSNAVKFSPSTFISEGVYVTTDGGENWFGSDTCKASPYTDHSGDPAPAIDMNGRFYMSYLKSQSFDVGIYASYSTDYGLTWANSKTITTASSDKNHTVVVNNASSPYNNRAIVSWSDFSASNPNIVVSYTTDGGSTWTSPIDVHTVAAGHYAQGCNGAMAPNGDVYMTWQNPVAASPYTGDFVGFAKSTDGGATWTANNNIYDCNGIRGNLNNKGGIRVNDFPWMGVDLSSGSRNGWIYIVTSEKSLAPAGNDPDIVLHKSTDGGTTWSAGIRVNQDALNNGKDQYMPAVVVDSYGGVNVIYYDSRNTSSDSAEVYISRSIDGGTSWQDIVVSDHRFKPQPISGLAGGYQGDYIGITEGPGGSIFPYWCDNASGIYQAWTAKVVFATFPLNAFNLNTPAAGTTLTSFPNSSTTYTFTWDTSASTASYSWIFGSPAASSRQLTLPTAGNSLVLTSAQLDNLLAGLGLNPGDSLVGQWNVWAYRNNLPANDSLSATNGPRTITLKRGIPQLASFNLDTPADNSTITTSVFNNGNVLFKWTKSGEGVKYKLKYGATVSAPIITFDANNSGYDTTFTIVNSTLDLMLQNAGLNQGDSITGVWAVYGYNGLDSLKSVETWNLKIKRQAKGDILVAYDSTDGNCIISKDSVVANLNVLGRTYDLFNRESNSATSSISFQGYKAVIWLGSGTSSIAPIQVDSVKSYLNAGGTTAATKSKFMVFSEDIGWNMDRTDGSLYDTVFTRQYLGWQYIADRPVGSGNYGLVGVTINPGIPDSTTGTYPDVIKVSWVGGDKLYKFRKYPDSTNAVGRIAAHYNVATFGVDIRTLVPATGSPAGSPVYRFIKGALDYLDENVTPVELTSFTASVNDNAVNLNWITATELNNSGFSVQRKAAEGNFEDLKFVKGSGSSTLLHTYSYTDKNVPDGKYVYRLKQVDFDGSTNYSSEVSVNVQLPDVFSLDQNYPNPFNPTTTIKYSIPTDEFVTMNIYNILGEKVMTLVNQPMKKGKYEIKFNGVNLASGVYIYRLDAGSNSSIKKMIMLK